jgi:hypothetical protein
MDNPQGPCIARINGADLVDLPADWSTAEKGAYLRLLLRSKGIDANRWYRVEYFPERRCWLLIQERAAAPNSTAPVADDADFFVQTYTILRRTARSAYAAAVARSMYFARHGRPYELPARPQQVSSTDVAAWLGPAEPARRVRFDGEGCWSGDVSPN